MSLPFAATGGRALGVLSAAAGRVALGGLDAVLSSRLTEAAVDRVVASPLLKHTAERVADAVVDSPATERLVTRVIESRLLDETVMRLLESEDLWILVEEIARSPAVTDAITRQSAGLADEVGEVVRERSRSADERLEQLARRVLRRGPSDGRPRGSLARAEP